MPIFAGTCRPPFPTSAMSAAAAQPTPSHGQREAPSFPSPPPNACTSAPACKNPALARRVSAPQLKRPSRTSLPKRPCCSAPQLPLRTAVRRMCTLIRRRSTIRGGAGA
ncbi:hypothetical protein T484DRAFT_2027238 [Baffinella frigidus]|nr:hypothetical protein T484DRAFT_2027238 [Cryptophyta sp. CCMP2293]